MVFALLVLVLVVGLVGFGIHHRSGVPETEPVSCDDEIRKLERWNADWSHPELESDFYYWDEDRREFVEGKKPRPLSPDVVMRPPVTRSYDHPLHTDNIHNTSQRETWKRDDPELPERAKRNVSKGVAGCRCDRLPEGMICSLCFFL